MNNTFINVDALKTTHCTKTHLEYAFKLHKYEYEYEYECNNALVVAVTGNGGADSSSTASDLSDDDAGAPENDIGGTCSD